MTPVDLAGLFFVLLYVLLALVTGTIRRVLGLISVYVALVVATNMGQQGGAILIQYRPNIPVPDARLYGWVFFFFLIVIALEGAASAVHARLQLAVVALDRTVAVVIGVVTSVVVIVAFFFMFAGYAKAHTNTPTDLQINGGQWLANSQFVLPLARATASTILPLLSGVLPRDSEAYFSFSSPK